MEAPPRGEIEIELAARPRPVGDARKLDVDDGAANRLGRAERPAEELDQIGHERRLTDTDPHCDIHLSPEIGRTHDGPEDPGRVVTESAESHEPERTDGRPPTKKGRPPARQKSLASSLLLQSRRYDPQTGDEGAHGLVPRSTSSPAVARAAGDPISRNDEGGGPPVIVSATLHHFFIQHAGRMDGMRLALRPFRRPERP